MAVARGGVTGVFVAVRVGVGVLGHVQLQVLSGWNTHWPPPGHVGTSHGEQTQAHGICGSGQFLKKPAGQGVSIGHGVPSGVGVCVDVWVTVGVKVGVSVGVDVMCGGEVGVNVAQSPAARHAACDTGLQAVGQWPSLGIWQAGPLHWQQSFGPRVGTVVGVGVGVKVAQLPFVRHAASRTTGQPLGQPAAVAAWQAGPAHWQQSFGPKV